MSSGGKCGYINHKGTVVISPTFAFVYPFSEGLALVNAGTDRKPSFGFIDRSGKMVVAPQFAEVESFSEGLARVAVELDGRVRFGYIDRTGKMAIPPQFEYALSFSEGIAAVSYGRSVLLKEKPSAHSFICVPRDQSGVIGGIPGGPGMILEHGKGGFIGKDGVPLNEPSLVDLGQFSEGLAPIHLREGWGFVDRSGTMVIVPQFSYADPFNNGLAEVRIHDKQAFIDHTGKVVWRSEGW